MKLQKVFKANATRSLLLLVAGTMLFSFVPNPGVDTFTISLNDELLLRDAVRPESSIQTIALPAANVVSVLKVHYSHCGKIGADRELSVRDGRNRKLRSWSYGAGVDMTVNTVEMGNLTAGNEELRLVYSSREIPDGRVLALLARPVAGS